MEHEEVMWLQFAKIDLGVAEYLDREYYPKPLKIICCYCHQAAEKAVKALIVALDISGGIPKRHNLSFLMNQIKNYVSIPENYFDYVDILTPYGIAIRYPNEFYLEEHHAQETLSYAREIVGWVEGTISLEET